MNEQQVVDGFTFWVSFWRGIQHEPDKDKKLRMYECICEYVFEGIMPDLEYPIDIWFDGIKPNLDSSIQNRANGKKGGRPRKELNRREKNEGECEGAKTPLKTPLLTDAPYSDWAEPATTEQVNQYLDSWKSHYQD